MRREERKGGEEGRQGVTGLEARGGRGEGRVRCRGEGAGAGMRELGRRGGRRGPPEAGGTALGGRCRNNGALPATSPRPRRASGQPAGPGRGAGRAPRRSRAAAAPPAQQTPRPLTLSDHGFEADGGHGAARVFGLRASSRDARGHRRLPGSAPRPARRCPPPPSRSGDRLTPGLGAGAPPPPERGCRPAGVSARGRGRPGAGPAGGGASRRPSASPARPRQSQCGPRARPRPRRCGWARGGLRLEREPRPPPGLTRRAPPTTARSPSSGS